MPAITHSPPSRKAARGLRVVVLGLLLSVLGLLTGPTTAAADPVPNLDAVPAALEKYVPGSAAWNASPWMTSSTCRDRGGDFGLWVAGVVVDTPQLLEFFQASAFGPEAEAAGAARNGAIMTGYRSLPGKVATTIPRGYCVDDLRRWAGSGADVRPFGFAWGVNSGAGHQTSFYCTDRAATDATRAQEYNRYFGAERVPCDGVHVACDNAAEIDRERCQAWNAWSDDYVRRIEAFRSAAITDFPATGTGEINWGLKSPGEVAEDLALGWFASLTKTIAEGAVSMLAESMTWWTRVDRSTMLESPAITEIQGMLRFIGIALLVGGVIWQGILMMYRRKPDPLISTGMGLLSFVGWSTLGGTLAVLISQAGTALADEVLDDSIEGFSENLGGTLVLLAPTMPGAIFFLGIILFLLSVLQWVLGFFRTGALVILLALLPTAAAGQLTDRTKPWLPKVLSWCLTLLLHQPVAAIIYAIGFTLGGKGGDISSALVGLAVLTMSVIAMPTMLRFFDWGGQQIAGGGGGGGAMAAGAAASMLGGGTGAGAFSRLMDRSGPGGGPEQGGDGGGAMTVSSAHNGDGPSTGEQPGGGAQPSSGSGADSASTAAASGGTGSAGSAAQAGAGTGVSSATGGATTAAAGTAGAAGTAATAAAGPVGVAAAGVQQVAGQAAQAAGGAMTEGSDNGGGR